VRVLGITPPYGAPYTSRLSKPSPCPHPAKGDIRAGLRAGLTRAFPWLALGGPVPADRPRQWALREGPDPGEVWGSGTNTKANLAARRGLTAGPARVLFLPHGEAEAR
jgi:hypothetical protein